MRGKQSIHPFTSMTGTSTGTVITPRAQGGKGISCSTDATRDAAARYWMERNREGKREWEREQVIERKRKSKRAQEARKKRTVDYFHTQKEEALIRKSASPAQVIGNNDVHDERPSLLVAKPKSSPIGPCKGIA